MERSRFQRLNEREWDSFPKGVFPHSPSLLTHACIPAPGWRVIKAAAVDRVRLQAVLQSCLILLVYRVQMSCWCTNWCFRVYWSALCMYITVLGTVSWLIFPVELTWAGTLYLSCTIHFVRFVGEFWVLTMRAINMISEFATKRPCLMFNHSVHLQP